jgi:hypothetical protein
MGTLKHRRPVIAPDAVSGQMGPIVTSLSDPVVVAGATGLFTMGATWQDIGGTVGRIRATVPADGTYLVHYGCYGSGSGTTGNADIAIRLTKDNVAVANSVVALGRIDSTVNPTTDRFGNSGQMALVLEAGDEIEIECVKVESAAHTCRIEVDASRGQSKLELIHYK